jgi:membrane-bound lytic murein transglycosylase D
MSNVAFSQMLNDTVNEVDYLEFSQTEMNFDSLLTAWYIKNAIEQDTINFYSKGLEHHIDIQDSVVIERLKKIPTTIQLAYNDKVNAWIQSYIKKGDYLIPSVLGLSTYYFPLFEEVLDSKNMPLELKYLAIVESALNPVAASRAGATGIWQFMYGTGKLYDLEINTLIDERRDPVKATYAAANFLEDLYQIYGDWILAIAAYNCGPGNVNKAIKRSGSTDYWEMYEYLPRETRGYVPAFIAVTYLMNYNTEHNFFPLEIELPTHTDTVFIEKKLHLSQVSEVLSIPLEQLRDMNPQYKKDIVPGHIEKSPLRLPFDQTARFIEFSDSIYAYMDSIYLEDNVKVVAVSTKTKTYSTSSTSYETSSPCDDLDVTGKTALTYTVKSGDNYGFIANWYDISTADLKCWNDAYSDKLDVGDVLTVYVSTKKSNTYKNINTMSFEEKQNLTSTTIVKTSTEKLDETYIYYTIKSGDTISSIAANYDGVTETDIKNINSFTESDVRTLQIGQVIKIKKK